MEGTEAARRPLEMEGYDYLRAGPCRQAGSAALVKAVIPILTLLDRALFGLRVEGEAHIRALEGSGAVGICNHVHWLDCSMVAGVLRGRRQHFVTLQSNLEMPVVGGLVRLLGGLPVPRERRRLPEFARAVREALEHGGVVHIYPEGELEPYCTGLRPFKNGAFSHAYAAGVPILPMCITYRAPEGLLRRFKRRPCMTLHVLPPVRPDPEAPRAQEIIRLRQTCYEAMKVCIEADLAPESVVCV